MGEALHADLAAWVWQTGVRRWRAFYWKDSAGVKRYEQGESPSILEAEYALQPPVG